MPKPKPKASLRAASPAPRRAWLLGGLAALAVLALLGVFVHLVQLSVQQGQSARAAEAAQVDARWRCTALRDPRERQSCRVASL